MTDSSQIAEIEIVDKALSPEEIQEAIEDIVEKLKKRNIEGISAVQPADYSAKPDAHGEGFITTLAVAFLGALAKEAAVALWKSYIWPSLEKRFEGKVKSNSGSA